MNKNLELSLEQFEQVVRTLLKSPSLPNALEANIASIRLMDFFDSPKYEEPNNKRERVIYSNISRSALRAFEELIPSLNGESRHVELYAEQIRGRIGLVNRRY